MFIVFADCFCKIFIRIYSCPTVTEWCLRNGLVLSQKTCLYFVMNYFIRDTSHKSMYVNINTKSSLGNNYLYIMYHCPFFLLFNTKFSRVLTCLDTMFIKPCYIFFRLEIFTKVLKRNDFGFI